MNVTKLMLMAFGVDKNKIIELHQPNVQINNRRTTANITKTFETKESLLEYVFNNSLIILCLTDDMVEKNIIGDYPSCAKVNYKECCECCPKMPKEKYILRLYNLDDNSNINYVGFGALKG